MPHIKSRELTHALEKMGFLLLWKRFVVLVAKQKTPVNGPGLSVCRVANYALAAGADSTICKPGTLIPVIFTWV